MTPTSPKEPLRVLYVCHDGTLYGSQQSLNLIVAHVDPGKIKPYVTIAKPGQLNELLARLPYATLLKHPRLQWVKHERQGFLKRCLSAIELLVRALFKIWALCRLIREHKIDIVHTNSVVTPEGALAAWLTGVPHVWHIRELLEEHDKFQMTFGEGFSKWFIQRFSSRVICISDAVRKQFSSYSAQAPEKFVVIFNAVEDAPPPPPKTSNGKFNIGYLGRVSPIRRFQDLVDALAILKREGFEQGQLVVAGQFVDAVFETEMREKIETLGLTDAVKLLGYQSDVAAVYAELDVVVFSLPQASFGRTVIEGMQAGVPNVAVNVDAVRELIDDGVSGLLYTPCDPEDLAEKIKFAITHPEAMAAIREKGFEAVQKHFSIGSQIHALEACYRGVLKVSDD